MGVEFEAIKPHIGSVVRVDRASLCDEDVVQKCLETLEERAVLVFPRIDLSDEEQLEFTDKLGSRVSYSEYVPGGTEAGSDVYKITLDPKVNNEPEYVLSTFFWHFDGAHGHIAPPKASLLSARKVAPKGGQTEFANTYAAYNFLPDDDKAEVGEMRVVHNIIASMRPFVNDPTQEDCARWIKAVYKSREPFDGSNTQRDPDETYEKEHPLVWTHADGRKSLVLGVSSDRIVDMPFAEGRAVLTRLLEWSVQPDFIYRHPWQEGDLVICNNPGALHRVIPYDTDSGRVMHRTTVQGVEMIN